MKRELSVALAVVAALGFSIAVGSGPAAAKSKPATSAEPPAGALIEEISFADSPPHRVYVDLAPEGDARPFRMMLDTGASASVMTPGAARAQGISVRRTRDRPYRKKIRLGKDLQFYVDTSSGDVGSAVGWEYALFGGDQLYPYVFEIDFPAKMVRFYDAKKYQLPKELDAPGESLLRLRVTANRPFVEVDMHGKKTWMLVDTGSPYPIIVGGRAAKRLGIDVDALPPLFRVGTTVSPVKLHLHEAPVVALGPNRFEEVPILVAPAGFFNIAGNTDSTLGFDILKQFIVRFDYQSGRMWLKRPASRPVTFLGVEYALTRQGGAFIGYAGNGYRVIGVLPGSPADRLGILPGDGLETGFGWGKPLPSIIQDIAEGREVTVVRMQDDIAMDIVLGPMLDVAAGASE